MRRLDIMRGITMALHIYNTASRRKEAFVPGDPGRITLYVCGPTVYNYPHIGNARPEVVFDVLARLLRRMGTLVYARNLTDVDDKINAAARREGIDIGVLTARFVEAYRADIAALGVLPPDVEPRATQHIAAIISLIERLIEAGHAYVAEGHVLYSVPSYEGYGSLSGRSRDDMLAGARVEVAPYKRDPADFVLWKPSGPELVGWESPWGRGRPGWHIECSAMVESHLGETIDIHGGGLDLVFPHHENECAQSVTAHGGKPFARYWMHNGLVNMASEKMSKSLGNMVLVRDLLQKVDGEVIRLGLLNAQYRQPLEWSDQLVQDSKLKLDRMYGVLRDAGLGAAESVDAIDPLSGAVESAAAVPPLPRNEHSERGRAQRDDAGFVSGKWRTSASAEACEGASGVPEPVSAARAAAAGFDEVLAGLEDDLNTPRALAALFGLVRAANKAGDTVEKLAFAKALRSGGQLLGLLSKDPTAWFAGRAAPEAETLSEGEIDGLLERREALRQARKFSEADAIRDELAAAGIVIEDVAGGSRWRRTS